MKNKTCCKCGETKDDSLFYKDKTKKDGKSTKCIDCDKRYKRENSERISLVKKEYNKRTKEIASKQRRERYLKNLEKEKQYAAEKRKNERETVIERTKDWRKRNAEYIKKYNKSYKKENRESISARESKRYKEELEYRILKSLYSRVNKAIRAAKTIKKDRTKDLIGCSVEKLKKHLEKKFKTGMTWDNYGFTGWHIDHIKPCASFDLTDQEQQKECFHYTNMQPLWAVENIKKGAKFKNAG